MTVKFGWGGEGNRASRNKKLFNEIEIPLGVFKKRSVSSGEGIMKVNG